MKWKSLDKVDTTLFKGIAILMIVTHNFMKHFPTPRENEFIFHTDRFFDFVTIVLYEPENVIRASLSFFGHFGVQIFIFLSAYGLTRKYSKQRIFYFPYLLERVAKIYPAFFLSICAWLIVEGWASGNFGLSGPFQLVSSNYESLIYKFIFFIPLQPFTPVGPWWFVPFIFQFYIIFPLLLYLYARWSWKPLVVISTMSILISLLLHGGIGNLNFYTTVFGHLPELCLGVYLAKTDSVEQGSPLVWVILTTAVYLLGNIYEIFWYISHLCFLIVLLAAFQYLVAILRAGTFATPLIQYFGYISMPLFLVHGFLAEPFITWAREINHWLLTIVLCLASLFISVVLAQLLFSTEKQLRNKLASS